MDYSPTGEIMIKDETFDQTMPKPSNVSTELKPVRGGMVKVDDFY
jgi:hypothetical protein